VCKTNIKNKTTIDNLICVACWRKIKKNLPPFCHCCGRHLKKTNFSKGVCSDCIRKKLHFDRAFSPCAYEGVIKELIHEFKYKNKDYLGSTLCKLLIEFIKEYNFPIEFVDLIVPIPLHKTKLREREFNQSEALSTQLALEFKKVLASDVLLRSRYLKTQTDLEVNERLLNVKDSFSVTKEEYIKDRNILLVDDVLTSGATTSEAAFVLKRAGARIVFVLTLAN
jgi:ComF family protein